MGPPMPFPAISNRVRAPFSLVAVFASALLAGSIVSAQDGRPPASVHAVRASVQNIAPRTLVTGSLRAAFRAEISAREAGPLLRIAAREGASVEKGDVIAEVDGRRLAAEEAELVALSAEARAAAVRTDAEAKDADADLAALESASKGEAVSERELRLARTRAVSAKADADAAARRVEALDARLELLRVRVTDAVVRAPFDGGVVELFVESGEWVRPGDPIATVVSTHDLEAWFDVPERMVSSAVVDSVLVRTQAGGDPLRGESLRIVPYVDPTTRTFRVIAQLAREASASGRLVPGMSVSTYLPQGEPKEFVTVPKDAIVYRPSGVTVTVVQGEDLGGDSVSGAVSILPVEIAFETERGVALEPGAVQPGAVVVVEGNERAQPGMPVQAKIQNRSEPKKEAAREEGDQRNQQVAEDAPLER